MVTAAQVLGARLAKPAEVDEALYPGGRRGLAEVGCGARVAVGEVGPGAAPHRVDEVVGGLDPLERRRERLGLQHIAADDLAADPLELAGLRRVADQAADGDVVVAQLAGEQAADVPGRAGDQDLGLVFGCHRRVLPVSAAGHLAQLRLVVAG